jgi:hypothetical protein
MPLQTEVRERAAVGRHFALALQNVDLHGRLIVDTGRERIRPLAGTVECA